MPRQARLVLPNIALHVIQRGHNSAACFRQEADHLVYLTLIRRLVAKYECALHAYCLMTNHVHLLLTPGGERACALLMRNLGQQYVQYFNRRYDRSGTLWEGRFRSCLVDSGRYVLACYRYIELNPVRAGMVATAATYRWSSHNGNAGRIDDKLLSPHLEYLALSNEEASRQFAYRQFFDEGDDPAYLVAVREATNGGFPMIDERLKCLVASKGYRLTPGKPGPAPASGGPDADSFSGDLGL